MPTVLIGSYPIRRQPGPFRDLLVAAGFTCVDPECDGPMTAPLYRQFLAEADAVIAGGEPLSEADMAAAPRLRVIARTGVGYDAVDLAAAGRRGIAVTITPGTNQESVAEQTFGLLLALARNIVGNDRTIKAGGWDRSLVNPIRGLTLGLVGLGRIGRAVATRARAFEMEVIAHDPAPATDFEARHQIRRVGLDELLATSDVVSLHAPLVESTRGLIRRETLARMKPGTLLINTARGGLVVEPDLYEALSTGQLAGAGLDVLDREPPDPANPLLHLPQVVLSPHVAGIDQQAMALMAEGAARAIVDLHAGRWPAEGCVVNPEIRDRFRW